MAERPQGSELRLTRDPLAAVTAPRKMCVPRRAPSQSTRVLTRGRACAAPLRSKSIRFGLMSNQEIQRVAEFHVFERNLYQMPQRAPLANGILDPRLVRTPRCVLPPAVAVHRDSPPPSRARPTRKASVRRARASSRTAAAITVRAVAVSATRLG